MTPQASPAIEGAFRVVSVTDLPARPSPNARRAAARILFWNLAFVAVAVAIPILF